jgi:hypothetical protein
MDEIVCVKSYLKIEDAEVGRTVLEGAGILATIFRDDCGGWMPGYYYSREGIRLMVNRADLARAREILEHPTSE